MCEPDLTEHEPWALRLALATATGSDFEGYPDLGEVLDDIKARGGDPWQVLVCAARDLKRALVELYDGPPEEWVRGQMLERYLDDVDE